MIIRRNRYGRSSDLLHFNSLPMNVITVTLIIETFSEVHSSGDCPGFTPDSLIKYMHLCANTKSNYGSNV